MAEIGLKDRIANYQPTKTVWLWSMVGVAVLTMVLGFTWGGWVTGGTASDRAEEAASKAVDSKAIGRFISFSTRG